MRGSVNNSSDNNNISSSSSSNSRRRLQLGGVQVETPALINATCLGNLLYSPPHLLAEVAEAAGAPLLGQLELADVLGKDFGDASLSVLQPGVSRPLLIASARHMTRGVGVCSKLGLDIDAPGGRKTVTGAKLAARLAIDRPWAVISPADEVPMTSGNKRLTKSTERTMGLFKQLLAEQQKQQEQSPVIFGVAVSGHTDAHLPNMAAELVRLGAQGIVVGGANLGEEPLRLSAAIARVRAAVGPTVPLLVQGADSMAKVLLAVRSGVDLVSSNLPALATAAGQALLLPLPLPLPLPSSAAASDPASAASASPNHKKPKTDGAGEGAGAEVEASAAPGETLGRFGRALDLWHPSHRADSRPVSAHCACHCCRNHTRAYVHHLLRARELLAEALLFAHNQHCLLALMARARDEQGEGAAGGGGQDASLALLADVECGPEDSDGSSGAGAGARAEALALALGDD